MIDAALIQQCSDPSLMPAIVEQFIAKAGSQNPLAITVKSSGRLILVPKPYTADEALAVTKEYIGHAIVRVGVTQVPLGIGIKDLSDLKSDIFEPCKNLRQGTAQFAKVLRIVSKWYGNPKTAETFPQIFDDAIHAWQTGRFDGEDIFVENDPGIEMPESAQVLDSGEDRTASPKRAETASVNSNGSEGTATSANMRIDLSRVGGD